MSDAPNDERDLTAIHADREPTAEEAAAARRASEDVDVDQVGEHFEEMTELGANVRGEGEIERTD